MFTPTTKCFNFESNNTILMKFGGLLEIWSGRWRHLEKSKIACGRELEGHGITVMYLLYQYCDP